MTPAGGGLQEGAEAGPEEGVQAAGSRVHLSDAQRVLGLFAQGLSGRTLHLRPVEALKGDLRPRGPATDGASLYLPEAVDVFPSARANLGWYRIAILHQLGLLERGSRAFSLDAARARIPGLPPEHRHADPDAPDLERFFALWGAPGLMRSLFNAIEDLRIDRGIRRDYPGARSDLDRVLGESLAQRAPLAALNGFAALLEGLVRFTLGDDAQALVAEARACAPAAPSGRERPPVATLLAELLAAAADVDRDDADAVDSARAATLAYRLFLRAGLPRPAHADAAQAPAPPADAEGEAGGPAEAQSPDDIADGPIDPDALDGFAVPFRGDAQPQLLQRRLRGRGIVGLIEGLADAGTQTEAPAAAAEERRALQRTLRADQSALRRAFGRLDDAAPSWLYDEWDHHRQDWLKGWCRLFERRLEGGDPGFLDTVHDRHGGLAHRIREQFRQIKPVSMERIRRVGDGDALDLDGLIEAVIDRRAGHASDERVYVRRQPGQRDVAAAFLLDMSASTDFQIPDPDAPEQAPVPEPEEAQEDIPYLWNFAARTDDAEPEPPRRRVIDVARESLALMSEALARLGDRHAVYGFSGYGRDEVDFFVAKDFDDRISGRTWAAMSAMEPKRSTRMGPAIRHALVKLARQDARMKVLMIVSDGFPEDTDYGPDREDREYGIQDTAMALREAARAGVEAFCITVDRAGHDYLRRMCEEDRYLVIDEVEDLPKALSRVYRALTA